MSRNIYRNRSSLGQIPQILGMSGSRGKYIEQGYLNWDFKGFDTDDRLSNNWIQAQLANGGATVSGGLWYGNNTDGVQRLYKNFPQGLEKFKITQKYDTCSGNDAGRGASGCIEIYPSLHNGTSTFAPNDIIKIDREMYASSATSYNGIPTYHRSVLLRRIGGVRNYSGANRESSGNTTRDSKLIHELEFDGGYWVYRVRSNNVLVTTYNFTTTQKKIYSFQYAVSSSTGHRPRVDEIILQY